MNNSDFAITLPTVSPFTPGSRKVSNLDSSTSAVGRDLTVLVGEETDLEAVLTDTEKSVLSTKNVRRRLWLSRLGRGVSFFFAIGCGVTAAAALSTLVAGPLFYVMAGVLCLSTTYANYRMTNNDVSNIFIGGIKGLFQKKVIIETEGDAGSVDKTIQYLSPARFAMLVGGVVLSLSFGMVFGALTYGSTTGLVTAFGFLGSISVALPPIGIVLGTLTFICLSCLMIKAFSDLVKTDDLKGKLKQKFIKIFTHDPERDAGKSRARFVTERLLVGITAAMMVVGILGLVLWGQISTLANCAREFGKILSNLGIASAAVVDVISQVIGIGFALAAQIPFILKTSVNPIFKLFTRNDDNVSKPFQSTASEKIRSSLLIITAALSATATATIALAGSALGILPILAGIGAFLNNFLGSVVNATLSEPLPAPTEQAKDKTFDFDIYDSDYGHESDLGSTATIKSKLNLTFSPGKESQPTNDITPTTPEEVVPMPSITAPSSSSTAVNDADATLHKRRSRMAV